MDELKTACQEFPTWVAALGASSTAFPGTFAVGAGPEAEQTGLKLAVIGYQHSRWRLNILSHHAGYSSRIFLEIRIKNGQRLLILGLVAARKVEGS